jgi:hypothetical protein
VISSLTCSDLRIADQLLDLAQFTRRQSPGKPAQFSSEQSWHLESCGSCRGALERARRLIAVHQSSQPSTMEIAAARARFVERSDRIGSRARFGHRLSWAVAVGLVLALTAVAAAQIGARRRAASKAASGMIVRARLASGPRTQAPQIEPIAKEPRAESPQRPSRAASPLAPTLPQPRAPVDRAAHSVVRSLDNAPVNGVAATAGGPAFEGEAAAGLWEAVSRALRASDNTAADSALARLAASDDAQTRDAARLARAQLWLSWGRGAAARAELEDLAATGARPIIRARARETLQAHP